MDQTELFWSLAIDKGRLHHLSSDQLTKLRAAQILRSHASKSNFVRAAIEVAKNINQLRQFVGEHKSDYVRPGRLDEVGKEKIEEQVAVFIRSCTANIRKLEALIQQQSDPSSQVKAYQHGVVLVLSERLERISASFDVCRSLRYQQLHAQRQQQQRRQTVLQQAKGMKIPSQHEAALGPHPAVNSEGVRLGAEAQQQIQEENRALQAELQSVSQQVQETEKSMSEISALSQMFSQQVSLQSEQTLQLYNQAVEASELIAKGNVNLQKAIRLNSSTRKFMFCFFLLASLLLLFFDWWSS